MPLDTLTAEPKDSKRINCLKCRGQRYLTMSLIYPLRRAALTMWDVPVTESPSIPAERSGEAISDAASL